MDGNAVRPTIADFEAAGLLDPADDHADEKLALLQLLVSHGATLGELIGASDRLPTIAPRLGDDHRHVHTADEVAEATGLTREAVVEIWRAAGFPDPGPAAVFSVTDVSALRLFSLGEAVVGHDAAMQFVRVLGNTSARIADAAVSAFIVNVARAAMAQDPVGLELARQNLQIVSLLPILETAIGSLVRHHLEMAQRTLEEVKGVTHDYDTLPLAVGFVDLVGSTAMSQGLGPRQLSEALGVFEAVMSDLVASRGGRLVKLIGDEAMFVCRDVGDACAIALEASAHFHAHGTLPEVRAGMAHGEVILREGDYFGPVVNLAARLVREAGPSQVVIDESLADLIVDLPGLAVGGATQGALKGFDQPMTYHELRSADGS